MDSPIALLLSSDENDADGSYDEKDKPKINRNKLYSKLTTKNIFRISLAVVLILIVFIIREIMIKFRNEEYLIQEYKINKDLRRKIEVVSQIRKPNYDYFHEELKYQIQEDTVDTEFYDSVKKILNCNNREYKYELLQYGNFWVLKNYIKANHIQINCHETITYTTHGDYTFLDNVIPLLERWAAPLSIALYAPKTDFTDTIKSINYIRNCLPRSSLVRKYATFHIFFSTKHIPEFIPNSDAALRINLTKICTYNEPYLNVNIADLYRTKNHLLYPINVARNIAKDAALTHFVLASDIELYPSPGLPRKFLQMIVRSDASLLNTKPKVFPLPIFEVAKSVSVPETKTDLQKLLAKLEATRFHNRICPSCHTVPRADEWETANETDELNVFVSAKRSTNWEPIFIGTHFEPHYDERLSWEGKSDKMTQGYAMCVLDYEYLILDNAFLVHKPGIKSEKVDNKRKILEGATRRLIMETILPEYKILYGSSDYCQI